MTSPVDVNGFYTLNNSNTLTFWATTQFPAQSIGIGWTGNGFTGVDGQIQILSSNGSPGVQGGEEYMWSFILQSDTNQTIQEYTPVTGAMLYPQGISYTLFTPGTFSTETAPPQVQVTEIFGDTVPMRDLGDVDDIPVVEPEYNEVKDQGFSSGSILSLYAKGPQEAYLQTDDYTKSQWNPDYKQHSEFVMYQRVIQFPPPSPAYQGQVVSIEIKPQEFGHLLSNMYLSLTLPALPSGQLYTEHVGRAILKQIDLCINETTIETLYDDWYIIRDQLFLDADEQLGLYQAFGTSSATVSQNIIIPLEFFFCRRHSHNNKGRERLRRPYFPLCAMKNQRLYIRFTFNPSTWWCNSPVPVDILPLPTIIVEEIILNDAERLYYQSTPLQYTVNRVQKESVLPFSTTTPTLQLTANFPVQTIAWFFRNQAYETSDYRYYNSRYRYGYTTQYIKTGVELTFPSGISNYIDVIDSAKITLNNVDIVGTFIGSLYYTFKQPLEHLLTIPSKNIYTYSFGLNPKEYNQGGYINFSKLDSQTTYLTLNFKPGYASQILAGYTLNLFYSGYTLLQFSGGFGSLPFN